MQLQQDILDEIATRFVDAGVTDRHVNQEYSLYTNIYGVDEENPEKDLQLLFDIAIQNRARSLSPADYRTLSNRFDPDEFLKCNSRSEAFDELLQIDDIGPKIVNEFLRKAVHVFEVKGEWESDLHIPLDTHVVKALIKTGAINLQGEDWETDLNKNYQRVVNMTPNANPTKKIAHTELQDGFAKAASQHNRSRIVFDELWVEHSRFISNPLLQSESILSDLVLPEFRY